jgi:ParB-like chromosome segregation protein Spo0J
MEIIEVSKLKQHPRNSEFFDDIQGDNWTEFKKSIESSGVIEPIVISQECLIVSGHQRVRACMELGIKEIPVRIKIYEATERWTVEDVILKELLETNLRQRGIGNTNNIKLARCLVELERIYGITRGGDRKSKVDNPPLKTQEELAGEIGLAKDQVKAYKKLLNFIPELQDLVETGEMKPTVGYKVWATIPTAQQKRLVEELGKDAIAHMTQRETQKYLGTVDDLKLQMKHKDMDIDRLTRDNNLLEKKVQLNQAESDRYNELKSAVNTLRKQKDDIAKEIFATTELSGLVVEIRHLLKTKLAPIKFSNALSYIKDEMVQENLSDIVGGVQMWCDEMSNLLTKASYIIIE